MSDPENDSAQSSEAGGSPEAIDDEQLPEDLRPSDDNPLAQPLDPADDSTKDPDELDMQGGKPAEEWDSPDRDDSQDEDEPSTDD